MQFYNTHVLRGLTHLAMRQEQLRPCRQRVVSRASGRVLEVGIGSGLNLPLYPVAVDTVVGVDPSPGLLHIAEGSSRGSAPRTELIEEPPRTCRLRITALIARS
jgi:ubiquinone/menaquinone biosynthesis C-methylase UbiE